MLKAPAMNSQAYTVSDAYMDRLWRGTTSVEAADKEELGCFDNA